LSIKRFELSIYLEDHESLPLTNILSVIIIVGIKNIINVFYNFLKMFSAISMNPETAKGKRINETGLESKKNKHHLGRPEWQQEWKSLQHSEYNQKDVHKNK
jgi:hypothetical protein